MIWEFENKDIIKKLDLCFVFKNNKIKDRSIVNQERSVSVRSANFKEDKSNYSN